jgi:hypothetical protein
MLVYWAVLPAAALAPPPPHIILHTSSLLLTLLPPTDHASCYVSDTCHPPSASVTPPFVCFICGYAAATLAMLTLFLFALQSMHVTVLGPALSAGCLEHAVTRLIFVLCWEWFRMEGQLLRCAGRRLLGLGVRLHGGVAVGEEGACTHLSVCAVQAPTMHASEAPCTRTATFSVRICCAGAISGCMSAVVPCTGSRRWAVLHGVQSLFLFSCCRACALCEHREGQGLWACFVASTLHCAWRKW